MVLEGLKNINPNLLEGKFEPIGEGLKSNIKFDLIIKQLVGDLVQNLKANNEKYAKNIS